MSDFADFMSALHESAEDAPTISHEGMIARLREYESRFGLPCKFKPGDLVTARRGGIMKETFVGIPHVVLEVFPNGTILCDGGEPGVPEFMHRVDMRVAQYTPGCDDVVEQVVHSIEFEPYHGGAE